MVGGPTVLDGHTVERILFLTTERVPVEATHWSTGLMARYAGATQWQVRQVWQAADVTAHRLKTLTVSVGRGHRRRGLRFHGTSRYAWPRWSGVLLLGDCVDWTINLLP